MKYRGPEIVFPEHPPKVIYQEDVIEAICSMDAKWLAFLLDKYAQYNNCSMEKFIELLEQAFAVFRAAGDTSLNYYSGSCNRQTGRCKHSGKDGGLFVGKNARKYLSFSFEVLNGKLLKMFECYYMTRDGMELFAGKQLEVFPEKDSEVKWKRGDDVPF